MTPDTPIHLHTDPLHVTILPRGAALVGVRLSGQTRNLVLGFADPADHSACLIFAGPLVGPVANRIRDGLVRIDGTTHRMPRNENGRTTLHSGPDGLHAQNWQVTDHRPDMVTLKCTLADRHGGLPGNRRITARYALSGSTLRLTITATTDQTTPINIAAHPYWNLDGAADVSGHRLSVAAQSYLPVDADNLPTGDTAPVEGTPFDFRQPFPVPLTPALDVNYCLAAQMLDTPAPPRSCVVQTASA
ncbi:galactose mutarotase [Sulfitobacter aestuariivivens]|uniref:aldose epimerase family protein n=1 Tax=Sulfitobacter aestuariivivens TaxID=2766981 RepID=UPI0036236DFA